VPPKNLSTLVLEGEIRLRVHVACPGCDENLFNAASLLEQVVSASGGTVANTNSPVKVVAQATYIGGPRHSCAWEADASPDFYIFDPTTDADEFFADPVASQGDCPTEMVWSGDSGAFHPDDEIGGFRLCPETCKSVQAFPVDFLDIYSCE